MPDASHSRCQLCGKDASPWALSTCPICSQTICRKCGIFDYGRTFCSKDCAILFFHGDDEDLIEEDES